MSFGLNLHQTVIIQNINFVILGVLNFDLIGVVEWCMLEFEDNKKLSDINVPLYTKGMLLNLERALNPIIANSRRFEEEETPSEINDAAQKVLELTHEFKARSVQANNEGINDISSKAANFESKMEATLTEAEETYKKYDNEVSLSNLIDNIISGRNGGPVRKYYLEQYYALMEKRFKLKQEYEAYKPTIIPSTQELSQSLFTKSFLPVIYSFRAEHACKNYSAIKQVAAIHNTDVDYIAGYLRHSAPSCLKPFVALLKANYSLNDLQILCDYAQTAPISGPPEQLAFLQFINHSLVPHLDYFEIWASKIHDLSILKDEIVSSLKSRDIDNVPRLEILGQKSIQLSGRVVVKDPMKVDTPKKIEALTTGIQKGNDARDQVQMLIADLNDPSKGDLKQRHDEVKLKAQKEKEKFEVFFNGLENALKHVDASLNNATSQRAKVWQTFVSAENLRNQIELAEFNSPENVRAFNRKKLWAATGGSLAGLDITAFGRFFAGWAQNDVIEERGKEEFTIKMKSLLARQGGNPDELRKAVDSLDKEIEKLAGDKEFNTFLSQSGAMENVRSIYMIFTRLIAGESNIAMLEEYAQASGYKKVDDFIAAWKSANGRLAQAMEKFAYGFANTNDLDVIIAESNVIAEKNPNPEDLKQKVLLEYVEDVIKPNYSDMARQASIVDHLQMRNALYTGHPFHSFGEVVKKETDAALRALLSGKGDFTFVGSNDIHQLFGFYLARHGEETFIDPHNPKIRKPKLMEVSLNNELQVRNKEVAAARDADTVIPRLTNVFVEICTHEYLLSQGVNVIKDKHLATAPEVLGATEMVNETVKAFIKELALAKGCEALVEGQKNPDGTPKKPGRIGALVEGLIADSCIQYFSQLGAMHYHDDAVQTKLKMVKNAYKGENFSLPHSMYTKTITGKAIAPEGYQMFLNIYQQNLEKYLEVATRENKKALLDQLSQLKETMKDIQLKEGTVLPGSEEARLRAHYRNHSLGNVGLDHGTWVMRTEAIHDGSRQRE